MRPCKDIHPDSKQSAAECRLCFLAENDPSYQKSWGLEVTATKKTAVWTLPEYVECTYLGKELNGYERQKMGLDHLRNWRWCDHPEKPIGEAVCTCRGCGIKCRGYVAEDSSMSSSEAVELAKRISTEPPFDLGHNYPLLTEAHKILLAEAVGNPPPVNVGTGRGIVQAVGGTMYFSCAYASVSVLRALGCSLPIEWWHLGPAEMDERMKKLVEPLGVVCIDALKVAEKVGKPRILNGWELKAFAVAHSNFQEVLFLDADNISVLDPSYLFDCPEYQVNGAVFWPDLPPNDRREWLPEVVWRNVGLEYRDEPDFESGQFIINKERCRKELGVTVHINSHSDWYYKFVFGDKSTFHLAWRVCGSGYGMPARPAGWVWPAIQQYDFTGRLLFQHVCQGKSMLAEGNMIRGLQNWRNVSAGVKALRDAGWSSQIWDAVDESEEEKILSASLSGMWHYKREVDPAGRPLELKPGGLIGEGQAGCELRWTARILNGVPTIVIVGKAHKETLIGMMFLTEQEGKWVGRWEAHERCRVELTREEMCIPWVRGGRGDVERICKEHTKAVVMDDRVVECRVFKDYKIYCDLTDVAFTPHMILHGFWECWVTIAIARMVKPGSVCVDVGANVGYYTVLFSALAGPTGRVLAVEPNSTLCKLLEMTRSSNGFRSTEIAECAVMNREGEATLFVPKGLISGASVVWDTVPNPTPVKVPAKPLDSLLAGWEKVDLIKIDAEGAEEYIWDGMQETLDKHKPTVILEYNSNRYKDAAGFLAKLKDKNRRVRIVNYDGGVDDVSDADILAAREEYIMLVIN